MTQTFHPLLNSFKAIGRLLEELPSWESADESPVGTNKTESQLWQQHLIGID